MSDAEGSEPLPVIELMNKSKGGEGPLSKGDKRESLVELLQEMLIIDGYDVGPSGIDGMLGDTTKTSIIKFQEKNTDWDGKKLKIDGLVGPRTADALNRSMVGKLYDAYVTPQKLTKEILFVTAIKDALMKKISLNTKNVKRIKIFLKEVDTPTPSSDINVSMSPENLDHKDSEQVAPEVVDDEWKMIADKLNLTFRV